jgi:hypothetical protein
VSIVVVLLRATLVVENVHVKPVDGETVATSETVPVKPWRPVNVTVELPNASARVVRVAGLATIV